MNVTITVERENPQTGELSEHEIDVEFYYHKAYRGKRDSCCGVARAGAALEPDEDESLEFESATDEDGKDFDLTDREIEQAEEKAWNSRD
jgi:hypothetical protein